MSKETPWKLIINPTSGSGKSGRIWPKIKKGLDAEGIRFKEEFTAFPGHSKEIVQVAIESGFRHIIVVGGDGTIHNVVNGIMRQRQCESTEVTLAVIPIGTGNDWIKTHNIPKNITQAIELIKNQNTDIQDVGSIEFLDSKEGLIYFNNLAGFGFDAFVVERVGKLKRFGALAYLMGAISGLVKFRPFEVDIQTDSSQFQCRALLVVAGICKYAGGGMRLTNYTGYNNGSLDFGIARNFNSVDLVRNIFRIFNGRLSRSKKVEQYSTTSLTARFNGAHIPWIQADGELIGKGNLQISIIKAALKLCK